MTEQDYANEESKESENSKKKRVYRDHETLEELFSEKVEPGYDLQEGDRIEVMIRSPHHSKHVRQINKKTFRVVDRGQEDNLVDVFVKEVEEDGSS